MIWIILFGVCKEVNEVVYFCGGIIFYDIINNIFVKKVIEKGVDGLIVVVVGVGGYVG